MPDQIGVKDKDGNAVTVYTNDALRTQLIAILAKLIAAPATEAKQDALIAKDFATQTTLAAVLAKLSADPATQTTLAAVLTAIDGVNTKLTALQSYVDGLEGLTGTTNSTLSTISGAITTLQGYVDGLETLIGATNTALGTINTSLGTIDGRVDGLEALITTLNGYTDGIEALIGTTNTALSTLGGYMDGVETLLAAATPAGENHVGEVGGAANLITVTATLDTSAYASGDLLADTQQIANALRISGGTAILHSVHLIDEDDQGVAMDIYILDANNSFGTENAAPSITDANARSILGAPISIATTDWKDLGGCRIAGKDGIGKIVKGNASSSLYFAIVNGSGAPTFTASGLRLQFGFLQN